ncbi:MAG TPA: hypothetical protein VGL13_05990 [Polyangiaceae bacterium]|jgi:hypothetical protein
MMKAITRCVGIGATVISLAGVAQANGRFPRALRLVEDPSDPNRLSLAATFGLVVTSDRGRNWYHICEAGFSKLDMYNGDPLLAVLPSGAMLVDVQSSLNVSLDHGCQWTPTISGTMQNIADFTVARTNPNLVQAVVITYQAATATCHFEESTDGGQTFKILGTPLPVPLVYTIDSDPKDPTHIFATGLNSANAGVFLRSNDHGATWTTTPIPNTGADESPYIAVIDPNDSNKIYIRTDAAPIVDGVTNADDALLYSSDGGQTWTEILRRNAKLFGFALSPDSSTVLAGYGDPVMGDGVIVDPDALGIYSSPTSSFNFSQMLNGKSVTCLTWSHVGLYACTSTLDSNYEVGFAPDANLAKCPLTPLLRLSDIRGPLPSCPGVSGVCDFATACMLFQCSDAGTPNPQPTAACTVSASDAGASGGGGTSVGGGSSVDASVGGGGTSAGTGGAAGASGQGGSAGAPPSGGNDSGGGCALSRRASREAPIAGVAGILAMALAFRARSAKTKRKSRPS